MPTNLNSLKPTSIYSVDLNKVSNITGVSEDELIKGIQLHETMDMQGIVVDSGQEVSIEALKFNHDSDPNTLTVSVSEESSTELSGPLKQSITNALITSTSTASDLAGHNIPKCLIQLGSQCVIVHILEQLYHAGIEKVVISTACYGIQVMEVVKKCHVYTKMNILFLDMGGLNKDEDVRAILAARKLFNQPFLIHMAYHIFEPSILTELLATPISSNKCAFMDNSEVHIVVEDVHPKSLKNSIQIKFKTNGEDIEIMGSDIEEYSAIDTGLAIYSLAIFDTIETLLLTKISNVYLSDVNSLFLSQNKLHYIKTKGRTWFSIDTENQATAIQNSQGYNALSPWEIFVATAPTGYPINNYDESFPNKTEKEGTMRRKSIMLGFSPNEDTTLRMSVGSNAHESTMFQGFGVGVGISDSSSVKTFSLFPNLSNIINPEKASLMMKGDEETPLLGTSSSHSKSQSRESSKPIPPRRESTPSRSLISSKESRRRRSLPPFFPYKETFKGPFVVSLPIEQSLRLSNKNANNEGYLIGVMLDDPNVPKRYVLAIPERKHSGRRTSGVEKLLPTDITSVVFETHNEEEDMDIQLVIQREVPVIAFVMLITALAASSSIGSALALQTGVSPMLKFFWRISGAAIAFFPLALHSIVVYGIDVPDKKTCLTMLVCALSYSYYNSAFVWAMDHTSVGHTYLFGNAHSLIIVLGKLLLRSPILMMEGLGASIGLLGGVICTMDHAKGENGTSKTGDLVALSGAVAGVFYLISASAVRSKFDIPVMMCFLTSLSSLVMFIVVVTQENWSFSMDHSIGLFGWLNWENTRLPIELYVIIVGSFIGTTGYINSLKYFQPLVVSVVMLLSPILANVIAVAVGVDSKPGIATILGGTLVLIGTAVVLKASHTKTQEIDVSVAMKKASNKDAV